MAVNERDRHRFYETARAKLGEVEADYLMEMLPPVGWADVATKHDLHELGARVDSKLDVVESRFDVLDSKLVGLEEKFDAKLTRLEARLMRANIVSMIGLAGLVLAAGAVG